MGLRDRLADWIRPTKHAALTLDEALKPSQARDVSIVGPTPEAPIPQPNEPSAKPKNENMPKADTRLFGAPGTPIISGFLEDMQEYNPQMQGRYALPTFEEMRRSDADVASTLTACKLPIRCADMVIQPGVEDNEPEYELAKEIADFVEENLFGGLEYENSQGEKFSQPIDAVIENALLCLDFGCSASEDLWAIDQDKVRLARVAPRLPLTFYQFPVDPDGETLQALVQWGYRGSEWVTAAIPAGKLSLFSFRKEGANFFGRALCREMYQHWFIKTALYRIDSVACERGAAGVPMLSMGDGSKGVNVDPTDRERAIQWVTNLSVNENTGLALPPGWVAKILGIEGGVRQILPSIQHHSEMICRAPLAMFMALGTTATGSRSLGNTMVDFFQLMEETIARFICNTISETTIRRLVDYNFPRAKGKKLPYPKLDIPHIAVINPLELAAAIKDLASATTDIFQPDDELENFFRKKCGLPLKGVVRPRFAPVVQRIQDNTSADDPFTEEEGPAGAAVATRSAGATPQEDQQRQQQQRKNKDRAQEQQTDDETRQHQQIAATLSRKLDGRMKWHGLDISIENAAGSTRSGVAKDGKRWSVIMQHPYGYIRKTKGVDGDHVDCFLGPDPNAQYVYVIHQKDPTTGAYDEDKCMLDWPDAESAKRAFFANYDRPDFFHSMTTLPVGEFIDSVLATKTYPSKIHASEVTRPLHPHEKHHDFDGHVKRQDMTQNAMRRILGSAKMGLFRDASRRAASLTPESLDSLQLPFNRPLAARIQSSANIAHQYGHSQVYAERYRATKRPASAPVVHLSKTVEADSGESAAQDTPELIAKAAIADLNNWVTSRTKGAFVDAYTKGMRDEVLQQAIEDNLNAGSDAMLDRIAAEASRSAVAGGRYSALLELASEISKYARSEAMDQNTCDECKAGDGTMWKSLDEIDWSPGDDCEGADACRGQLLPIFADEGTVQLG